MGYKDTNISNGTNKMLTILASTIMTLCMFGNSNSIKTIKMSQTVTVAAYAFNSNIKHVHKAAVHKSVGLPILAGVQSVHLSLQHRVSIFAATAVWKRRSEHDQACPTPQQFVPLAAERS